jgi:ribosomal protein S20
MPIIKSAKKQMRQDKKRYAQNLRVKRDLKVATKAFEAKPTFEGLKAVQSRLDTAVKKNVLKPNTGARRMKRFSKLAKQAGVKIPAKKAAPVKPVASKTTAKPAAKTPVKKPAAKKAATSKTTKPVQ